MTPPRICALALGVFALAACGRLLTRGDETPASAIERGFRDTLQPFLKTYCQDCHGGERPKRGLNLGRYTSADEVARDLRRFDAVLEHLETGTMPPAKAAAQPSAELRRDVIAWLGALRRREAKRHAGDPGPVPPRRLSNAEYDHTIRDLTGVDIRPGRAFPVDPANEAGFDNSADALALPPALVTKYLEAGRHVAEHLVLHTEGLSFAPFPVVAETDRDKYCVRRIIDFYKRQRTDYADYFQAAWRYRERARLGQAAATLAEVAAASGISAKYLAALWLELTRPAEATGPMAVLQKMWQGLPAGERAAEARSGCERMRDFVVGVRARLVPEVKNLTAPKVHNGSQTMVLWKNRQVAANRLRYAGGGGALKLEEFAPTAADAGLLAAPAAATVAEYEASLARFCRIFPDTFFVTERARVYLDPEREKKLTGRLLNAGFHSMTGYFRDDGPLCELMLDDDERRLLDRLWLDLDVITEAPLRQHTSFIWFERSDSSFIRDAEFDLVRAEDKDCTSAAKIAQFAELYLAKARRFEASEVAQQAIADHFKIVSANIRRVEAARRAAEPKHLEALERLAARAYRRPLAAAEGEGIVAFYRALRDQEGLSHEDAVRDTLVSILVSPHFLFRVEPALPGSGVRPLADHALASRLSYFLWASMPDEELLARAAAGELRRPEVLRAQARRMLGDERVRGLATEFGGNWLDFRRFEEHNAVDRQRFPAFSDELRSAMFEEPVRFLIDVFRNDGSVLDLLHADHTFVNAVLARHYGMPEPAADWARVDGAGKFGRGGLLPMGVFLTRNAPGLRTSPVKRGYWVVRRILGEKIPAPPAEVPELPADEAKLGAQTLRGVLARHRADKACAGCHERFDALGLAFEGYGPVGERRSVDLGGRPIDARADFPGGQKGTGLSGLRDYIVARRQDEFVSNLCRQFLAFALGRTLLPSDDDLIDDMRLKLAAHHYRFSILVDTIIGSPQFLNRRGDAAPETTR